MNRVISASTALNIVRSYGMCQVADLDQPANDGLVEAPCRGAFQWRKGRSISRSCFSVGHGMWRCFRLPVVSQQGRQALQQQIDLSLHLQSQLLAAGLPCGAHNARGRPQLGLACLLG